jgi:futalosine hydrolase
MTGPTRWLLAVAAPKEVEAVLRGAGRVASDADTAIRWSAREISARLDVVVTGVGKANAAGAVARALDAGRHAGVVSVGIAGSLPASGLGIGDVVVADRCAYADEGMRGPDGFKSIAAMGFGPLVGICGSGSGLDAMSIGCIAPPWDAGALPWPVRVGGVASVSTCSGTGELAREVEAITGAIVEDMESAAVGFTVARIASGLPFAAVKVVSNTTGDRAHQSWDIPRSLGRLSEVVRALDGGRG